MRTELDMEHAKQMMKNAMAHPGCGEHPCADIYKLCEHVARKNALCVELDPELGITHYHGKTGTFRMDGFGFVFVTAEY